MSSKEIKSLLKEARDLIKSKDFQVARKKCNDVLKLDKKNHMAYIFLGAAYQDENKSEAARYLKIALELNDDKSLALQGLANCADAKELPDVIKQLLKLFPEKFTEFYSKLFNVSEQNLEQSIEIFAEEVNLDVQQERIDLALNYLLKILFNNKEVAEKYKEPYIQALKYGIKDRQNINHLEYYQTYFRLLEQEGKFDVLLSAAEDMIVAYPTNAIPLEWICKVLVNKFENTSFDIQKLLKNPLEDYLGKLLSLNSDSTLGLAANGLYKYSKGDFLGARTDLLRVYNVQPNWFTCTKILGLVHMKLRAFLLAELVFRKCKSCEIELAESLVEQQTELKICEVQEILNKELLSKTSGDQYKRALTVIFKAAIYRSQFDNVDKILEKLKNVEMSDLDLKLLEAKLLRMKGQLQEACDILTDIEDKSHEVLMELGTIHFLLRNYDESLMEILKATKVEPYNSECFYMLGKIYINIKDEVRSKKCFEKCLSLNPQNEKAITVLSSIYRKNNEWESNLVLLENSVNSVTGVNQKTAFAQLGYHHLAQRNYDDAITAFRSFLRYDSSDLGVWEGLAEAYMNRGSYNSAMNVFEKTVELSGGDNMYAKLQIAKIKYITQYFQESIIEYEELIENKPDYVPALKGIAESHFGRAKFLLEKRRVGRAWEHCKECLKYAEKTIKVQSNLLSVWRLLGNLLDFTGNLPPKFNYLDIPGEFVNDVNSKELRGIELLELAAKCYSHCLKISENDEFVWYELTKNLYTRAIKFAKDQEKAELLKTALNASKYLVKLSASRWQNWNLLGVISMTPEINNPALAQHAFMQALTLDKKTYTCWNNLGVLYLQQGDVNRANKAFGKAQQFDTGFLNGWIGQAFVAELNGLRDESMDLFRHCTSLGFHLESSLGYSNFVCSVLNESNYWKTPKFEYAIDKMNAVPLALDSMTWHCQEEGDAAIFESLIYLGYLNSRQGLWKPAIDCYQKALEKCDGLKKNKCLTDLGYCYLKIDKFKEAIQCFGSLSEATFSSSVGLALAYFKAKNYEDSYSTYQSAVEWLAQTDTEKSSVLVAMAAMVYAFQGEGDAKMLLFQCIGLPNPPPEALFSLCAISLMHDDQQLSDLTIKELEKFEGDEKYSHHVIFLISQFYLKKFDKKTAFNYVLSKIHIYPERPQVRKVFVDLVMEDYKRNTKKMRRSAAQIAQSTIVLRSKDTKQKLTADEAAKTLAVACEAVRSADPKLCKLLAQKAVHMNPMYRELLEVCH